MKALIARIVDEARDVLDREEAAVRADLRSARVEAEDELARIQDAARTLGRVQGETVRQMVQEDASAEIADVERGAFDALAERFLRRVHLALEGLRSGDGAGHPAYGTVLNGWAARATAVMTGPTEVTTSRADRRAVFDALLAAGRRTSRSKATPASRLGSSCMTSTVTRGSICAPRR